MAMFLLLYQIKIFKQIALEYFSYMHDLNLVSAKVSGHWAFNDLKIV